MKPLNISNISKNHHQILKNIIIPVNNLKWEQIQPGKDKNDDGLKDDKNAHKKVIDALIFLVTWERSMTVHLKELDKSHQEISQWDRTEKKGSKSDCQCTVTLKDEFRRVESFQG